MTTHPRLCRLARLPAHRHRRVRRLVAHIVVVGAGVIGIDVAAARRRGIAVTVLEVTDRAMGRVVSERTAAEAKAKAASKRFGTHVKGFAEMMTHRTGENLENWLTTVQADDQPELHSFVIGIRRDQPAVTAGLTLPHSSGKVEGNVNRLKMIKRKLFGRANFDLLRKLILLSP